MAPSKQCRLERLVGVHDNYLFVEGGNLNPSAALDRDWKYTWHTSVAVIYTKGNTAYSMGLSYDSSLVSNGKRTIDLPMD